MKNQFALKYIGISTASPEEAERLAKFLSLLFNLEPRHGQKSEFAGPYFECMKQPFLGNKGCVVTRTENLQSMVEELKEKGFSSRMKTAAYFEDGSIRNVYLGGEYGGFAIHIMRK